MKPINMDRVPLDGVASHSETPSEHGSRGKDSQRNSKRSEQNNRKHQGREKHETQKHPLEAADPELRAQCERAFYGYIFAASAAIPAAPVATSDLHQLNIDQPQMNKWLGEYFPG
jgi:hypothetical protein